MFRIAIELLQCRLTRPAWVSRAFFTPRPAFSKGSNASSSFLKKNQELLTPLSRRSGENRDSRTKAFCFFFSKKKGFMPFDAQDLGIQKLGSSGKQSISGKRSEKFYAAVARSRIMPMGRRPDRSQAGLKASSSFLKKEPKNFCRLECSLREAARQCLQQACSFLE